MTNLAFTQFNDPFDSTQPIPEIEIKHTRVNSYPGTISNIKSLTYDTIEVTVTYESDIGFFSAHAGQYGTLKVEDLDRARAFSFAKAPELENPNEVTFFIRFIEGGGISDWFKQKDRKGEKVIVSGAMGNFALDKSDNTIVCIAGGSGMSAIKALVEQACHDSLARDCYFFYGARTQADLYCQQEMADIAKNWNPGYKFSFIPVLSMEPENSDWKGPRGFVTEHFNQHYIQQGKIKADTLNAFFCGPPPMIDHGVEVLTSAGVSLNNIRYDKFEDASSPAPVIDNTKCTACDECLLVKPVEDCIVEATNFILSAVVGEKPKVTGFTRISPTKTSGIYYNSLFIDESKCIKCNACVDACPHGAISPNNQAIPVTLKKVQNSVSA